MDVYHAIVKYLIDQGVIADRFSLPESSGSGSGSEDLHDIVFLQNVTPRPEDVGENINSCIGFWQAGGEVRPPKTSHMETPYFRIEIRESETFKEGSLSANQVYRKIRSALGIGNLGNPDYSGWRNISGLMLGNFREIEYFTPAFENYPTQGLTYTAIIACDVYSEELQ